MSTYDTIRNIAPPLSDATDEELDTFVTFAKGRMDVRAWGDLYTQGVVYLSAHLATRSGMGSSDGNPPPGDVASVKTRDLSVTYRSGGEVSAKDSSLASTSYGREWLALRSMIGSTPIIV